MSIKTNISNKSITNNIMDLLQAFTSQHLIIKTSIPKITSIKMKGKKMNAHLMGDMLTRIYK